MSGLPNSYLLLLVGDSLNSSLVAIVSVDQDVLKAWADSEGIKVQIWFSCTYVKNNYSHDLDHNLNIFTPDSGLSKDQLMFALHI